MTDADTFNFYTKDPLTHARDYLTKASVSPSSKKRKIAKTAIEISNQCLEAWRMLAQTYQKYPQAKTTYLKALEIGKGRESESTYQGLLKDLGKLYLRHGNLDEAVDCFLSVLKLDSSDPHRVREPLTLCYLHQEEWLKAHAIAMDPSFEKSLSSKVAQAFIAFRTDLPWWTPDQMDEINHELLGRTTWQWIHEQCNSLKRLYRAINHSNPFFAAFMLNPSCLRIQAPSSIRSGHACEAIAVVKQYHQLWHEQELPIRLLEEFPWSNPNKSLLSPEDKPLLLETILQLEKHRDTARANAEKEYLRNSELY